MPQTPDVVHATWDANVSALVGRLSPQSYNRRIVLMALEGPSNSTLAIYDGYVLNPVYLLTTVFPASRRTYDSMMDLAPITIYAGQAATFAWTGGASGPGISAFLTVRSQWGRGS